MIQFNLLPDIKLEYIKAKRTKRAVILISAAVAGSALALFILFFLVVNVAQKQHLGNLQDDIDGNKKTLQGKQELSQILTIQNQLNSLPALHAQKPVATRIYSYIQQVTPQKASISSLTVNFADQTMKIDGNADTLVTVNTFVDTLKFTTFNTQPSDQEASSGAKSGSAFSEVVLAGFGLNTGQSNAELAADKRATYSITLKFDPAIFDGTSNATLVTNPQVTTRSETEKPNEIFQTQTKTGAGQ